MKARKPLTKPEPGRASAKRFCFKAWNAGNNGTISSVYNAETGHPGRQGIGSRFHHRHPNLTGILLSTAIHCIFISLIFFVINTRPDASPQERIVPLSLTTFQTEPAQSKKQQTPVTKVRPVKTRAVKNKPVKNKPINNKPVIKKPLPVIKKKTAKPRPVKYQPVEVKQQTVAQSETIKKITHPQVNRAVSLSQTGNDASRQLEQQYSLQLRNLIARQKKYPKRAKQKRQQGKVIIAFTVFSDGHIQNISIKQSSGSRLLDQNAINTIKRISGILPFPDKLDRQQWAFTLPLVYHLH